MSSRKCGEGGIPSAAATKAASDPAVGAVLGGMDPQQAIVAGGNLLADFRANAAAEAQGRVQTARLYNMTDDAGVKNMLRFNLARDTLHQDL
jgi:Mn-containing catalase